MSVVENDELVEAVVYVEHGQYINVRMYVCVYCMCSIAMD